METLFENYGNFSFFGKLWKFTFKTMKTFINNCIYIYKSVLLTVEIRYFNIEIHFNNGNFV